MVKAVIFDFDGTLADSSEGIFYTARRTVESLGFNIVKTDEEMKSFVGPMLPDCFRIVFKLPEDNIESAVERYREIYDERGYSLTTLYPNMREALIRLKKRGIRLAIATNKAQPVIDKCASYLGLDSLFDIIAGSEKGVRRNKAETIGYVISTLKLDKEEILMVGDTENDREGAENNGVSFMAALWGFGYRENEELSLRVAHDALEMEREILGEEKL